MAGETPVDRTQQLLDALSSPVRREILWLIWDEELTAGEIAGAFALTAPTISTHLGVLRRASLITLTRDGTFRRYRAVTSAVEDLRSVLGRNEDKWRSSGTRRTLAPRQTVAVAVVGVDAPCDQAASFRAFTDDAIYSRWVGVPVTLRDGRFATTMEWGLRVRGFYDHVVAPTLIVMRWDFEQGEVPIPGDSLRAYLEITPNGEHSHVEVNQLVRSDDEARYMERAWGLVLARFASHVLDALDPSIPMAMRASRPRAPSVDDQ